MLKSDKLIIMSNNFGGSIDDLMDQDAADETAVPQAPPLHVASEETEKKFDDKMDDIKKKELENKLFEEML